MNYFLLKKRYLLLVFEEYYKIVPKGHLDRAVSAKTDNRPQFQELVKDSSKKLFDAIIVWKLDRFARNRYDSAKYKAILKKNGVREYRIGFGLLNCSKIPHPIRGGGFLLLGIGLEPN